MVQVFNKNINIPRDILKPDKSYLKKNLTNITRCNCGVSGAIVEPIPPDIDYKNYDYIKLKDMKGNQVWGKYYRCCDPCCADLMREDKGTPNVRVEKYNYRGKSYNVITIEDPCKNPKKNS